MKQNKSTIKVNETFKIYSYSIKIRGLHTNAVSINYLRVRFTDRRQKMLNAELDTELRFYICDGNHQGKVLNKVQTTLIIFSSVQQLLFTVWWGRITCLLNNEIKLCYESKL